MRKRRMIKGTLHLGIFAILLCYFLQHFWAHRYDIFTDSSAVECVPLLGMFTMEDRVVGEGTQLTDLQPGDILLTLSTHSLGWRHGHAGLVIDEDTVLECVTWGQDSTLVNVSHWETYSSVTTLRVKGVTEEMQEEVVAFALDNLLGVPYHLSSGFLGEKAVKPDVPQFGLHCSYLVWYAWNQFGYDLDSDGGRLVTCYDLLQSDLLEVVQMHGMTPRGF